MKKRVSPASNDDIEAELRFLSNLHNPASAIQAVRPNPAAAALEAKGYRAWYTEIFGARFVNAWAEHHEEAIKWHWTTRLKLLRGEALTEADYTAYLALWSRGHMKSTVARRIAVCDAALSATAKEPAYILYVGGTNEKKADHAVSIGRLLQRKKLLRFYPQLGEVQKTARGHSAGDTQDFKYLSSGCVFRFVSLDSGIAGGNIELNADPDADADEENEEGTRPTFIIPDDVDPRGATMEQYAKRALRFTTELLPMRQWNTLVFGAQNIIQRGTIFYQIYKNLIPALARRYPTKPIPAAYDCKYVVEEVDGVKRARLISCKPTWPATGFQGVQELLWELGPEAFELECQHNVDARKTGLVLNQYNDKINVISWSQFKAVYGETCGCWLPRCHAGRPCPSPTVPRHWTKYTGHDWGNTHANVTSTVATAAADSARPGLKFLYAGITAKLQSTVDEVALQFIERHSPIDTSPVRNVSPDQYAKWGRHGAFSQLLNAPREIAREQLAERVGDFLAAHGYYSFAMSHEQKRNCEVYNESYGIPYEQCNPGASGGISEINRDFHADMEADDPFRPGQKGLAGLYLIVDDDQIDLDQAKDDAGLKLWREQFLLWSWRETKHTESGLSDDKPQKVFDDCGNSLMMMYVHSRNLEPAPLTVAQQVEANLPVPLQSTNIGEFLLRHGAAGFHAFQRDLTKALQDVDEEEGFSGVPIPGLPSVVPRGVHEWMDRFQEHQDGMTTNLDPSVQPSFFKTMMQDEEDE